ncbi:proline-rich protein 12-like [Notolabrus celidotus]|uniref:proline-rich protein 12-like n=1 Tax=Notolabrus celidotus TaxID=1203425 RepID=UPI00148F7CA0|nr:proline-rich protein 12-like [Notolabrus celidotus]
MDQADERLCEEVRRYPHLYDSSSVHYKDCQMAVNSWREISTNTGMEIQDCTKRWKNSRDKFVRLRRKMSAKSGDPGGKKVPALYIFLSWLSPHIKHRETESNYDEKIEARSTAGCSAQLELADTWGSTSELSPLYSDCPSPVPSPSPVLHRPTPVPSPSPVLHRPTPAPSPSPVLHRPTPAPSPSPVLHRPTPAPSPLPAALPSQSSPLPNLQSPLASRGKRKRKEQDEAVQVRLEQLEERRLQLQQTLLMGTDEYVRFGQTVADLIRRLPEDQRGAAMFETHRLLFQWQENMDSVHLQLL